MEDTSCFALSLTGQQKREQLSYKERERNFFQHIPFFSSSEQRSSKNTKAQGQKLKAL